MSSRKKAHDHGIPMRTCISCRGKFPSDDMIRISYYEGNLLVSHGRKKEMGRGAYLCRNPECAGNAFRKGLLKRAFRTNFSKENLEDVRREVEEQLIL